MLINCKRKNCELQRENGEFPQIEKQAKEQDDEIHWGDENRVKNQSVEYVIIY